MTTNASLPPADVQRPEPSLTEEDLAELMDQVAFFHRLGPVFVKRHKRMPYLTTLVLESVPRLIADLRAAHEKVKNLEDDVRYWQQEAESRG